MTSPTLSTFLARAFRALVLPTAVAMPVSGPTPAQTLPARPASAAPVTQAPAPATAPAPMTAAPAAVPAAPAARGQIAVELVKPLSTRFEDRLSATGNVAAWQEASVSPQANGLRVVRVLATVGNVVKRGDVMLEFDDETLRAELAQIEANIAEAEAAVADAIANAQRARQVKETGALSAQQVQQLLTSEKSARARLLSLQEAARLQKLRIRQAKLVAPDDGIVSFRAATLGAVVPAGIEMFRIIRKGRLEWRAEVPAAQLGRLMPGQGVRVVAEGGTVADGTVRQLSPVVDPASRNAIVYVDLPADTAMRPGTFARGEFLVGAVQAPALPQSALLLRDGFHWVARVDSNGRVNLTKVTVGRRESQWVEITGGLPPGAAVVASGIAFLADGDTVRVVTGANR